MTQIATWSDGFAEMGVQRGDYITIDGSCFAVTTSGLARGERGKKRQRVTCMSSAVLTVRDCSSWRVVEWVRARYEGWFAWPLADIKARFRLVRA